MPEDPVLLRRYRALARWRFRLFLIPPIAVVILLVTQRWDLGEQVMIGSGWLFIGLFVALEARLTWIYWKDIRSRRSPKS